MTCVPWVVDEVVALDDENKMSLATCSLGASLLPARGSSLMTTELQKITQEDHCREMEPKVCT